MFPNREDAQDIEHVLVSKTMIDVLLHETLLGEGFTPMIYRTGLYDVLPHQFHVEAARLLGFTEEDFVKTLDWDSK